MSKPIIIPESTEFVMNGTIFKYIVVDGNIQLTKLGVYDKKVKPKFNPPTLQEVKDYFKSEGYSEASAIKFHKSYSVNNWKDSNDKPVKGWKQKAVNVWFKDENKIIEETKKSATTVNNFFQKDE